MIAVICCNLTVAYEFVRKELANRGDEVQQVNLRDRNVKAKGGEIYLLVQTIEQVRGNFFSEVLVSPCYSDLLIEAKARVRDPDAKSSR